MHNKFIDKKRRFINFRDAQVDHILPEHFAASYPKFISLLEEYYDFQDQNNSTELLNHLFAARDINETDITLLNFIEDELLLGESYFEGFTGGGVNRDVELRAAANFSNILFRSKGSKFAIEWFFRSFYGEQVDVLYPKDNVFTIGIEDSLLGPDSLKYLTDDKLYQTFALLIRVGIPISRWREVFKLFAHPAGMYLGGEVLLVDEIDPNLTTPSAIVTQFTTPNYTIATGVNDVDEGAAFTLTANGANVQNGGTDFIYWYGKHITTSDSDFGLGNFATQPTLRGLPDSNTAQYLEINSSTGSVTVPTVIDLKTDPEELDEEFKLYIRDKNGRDMDSITVTLNNIIESYGITFPDATFFNTWREGEGPFTVSISGVNAAYGGNTTLKWYINPAGSPSITDSDFSEFSGAGLTAANGYPLGYPDSAGNAQDVVLTNGIGSFQLTPRLDANSLSEGLETCQFALVNENNVQVGLNSVNILNVTSSLTISAPDFTEGDTTAFVISSGSYFAGAAINYVITGDASTESPQRLSLTSGQVVLDGSGAATLEIPTSAFDDYNLPSGQVSGTIEITEPVSGTTGSDTFNILDAAPVYSLTANPGIAAEGDTVTFTVSGTNIPDDDVFFYVDNSAPNPTGDADFNPSPPPRSGSRTTVTMSGGTGDTDLTFAVDGETGDENFIAYIYDQSTGGTELASLEYIIQGSSTSYSVDLSATSFTEVETETLTVTFNASADGTYYYAMTSSDNLTFGGSSGTGATNVSADWYDITNSASVATSTPRAVVVSGGTGTFDLRPEEDFDFEGSETFRILMLNASNATLATSAVITLSDTSTQEYQVLTVAATETSTGTPSAVTSFAEGTDLGVWVKMTNAGPVENVYVEITGTGVAAAYTTTQQTRSVSSNGYVYIDYTANADNGVVDGDRTITVTARRTSHTGDVVATTTATLTDGAIGGTGLVLTTPADDPFDEGDIVSFTYNGSNISDGTTYYARATEVYANLAEFTNNSTIVYLPGHTGNSDPGGHGIVAGMQMYYSFGFQNGTQFSEVTSVNNNTGGAPNQIVLQSSANSGGFASSITALPDLWRWYNYSPLEINKSVTVNSNTATFTVQTAENTVDVSNKTLTMRLANFYENLSQGLPSERLRDFTLNNITSTVTDFDWTASNPFQISGVNSAPLVNPVCTARGTFKFELDGSWNITARSTGGQGVDTDTTFAAGTWASGTPAQANLYSIEITNISLVQGNTGTPISNFNPYFTGSYQTPLSLNIRREFEFNLETSGSGQAEQEFLKFAITFELVDNIGAVTTEVINLWLFVEVSDVNIGSA